ncbi:uncharacterized protein LOC144123832 [Amblyomma americanum]
MTSNSELLYQRATKVLAVEKKKCKSAFTWSFHAHLRTPEKEDFKPRTWQGNCILGRLDSASQLPKHPSFDDMSKKEDNNEPAQNQPGPSHVGASSPRHGHKKSKKGDPELVSDYQRTGKRRQSRGGKSKKRDGALSAEASVLRSRKVPKSRVKKRFKGPHQDERKLSKEIPAEDIVYMKAEREDLSPKQEENIHDGRTSGWETKGRKSLGADDAFPVGATEGPPGQVPDAGAKLSPTSSAPSTREHSTVEFAGRVDSPKGQGHEWDEGAARPSRRASALRGPSLTSPEIKEGALHQESSSRRPSAMPASEVPQTGAGGQASGELYDLNGEMELPEVKSPTLKVQQSKPSTDRWPIRGRFDSVSPKAFLPASEHRKSAQMTSAPFPHTASKQSVITEGFEHERLVEEQGLAANAKETAQSPRSGFASTGRPGAKDYLFSADLQAEKTEARQMASPNRMTDGFELHDPQERFRGVQARRSVTVLKEELTPAVEPHRSDGKERLPEAVEPEPDHSPGKLQVAVSVVDGPVPLSQGAGHENRLQQDQPANPPGKQHPHQVPSRADTSHRPVGGAQTQSEWDDRLRGGHAPSRNVGRSSQQPSPREARPRKPSRANVKGLGMQPERSTLHGRGNVDEFVEKMSVKPMFQDGCRRGSYIITADMEQFIPKHVIATANGTDAQTQKLTPHKLCLLLLLVTLAVFLLLAYSLPDNKGELVTVNTTSGLVQGFKIAFEKSPVYTFLGIPFGNSLTATARFLRPQPVTPREQIIDGTKVPKLCIQARPSVDPGDHSWNDTSEDCLSLNVWTPVQPGKTMVNSRIVLFVLHGRDLKWSREYDAAPLSALGDLVVVVPNYRLHLLGFLSNGTDFAPGNLALHDQIQALRWTVDNAEQFGGNRSSIVILGHGSGAVSLGLHLLSPIGEQDLRPVNRLAFMSGSPMRPFATNSEVAVVAASLGCNGSLQEGGAEWQWACLLKQPASEFAREDVYARLASGPSFDSDYLPQRWPQPSERVLRKQVLIGNTVIEGAIEIALKTQLLSEDKTNLTAFIMDELESLGVSVLSASRSILANVTSCTHQRCSIDFKACNSASCDSPPHRRTPPCPSVKGGGAEAHAQLRISTVTSPAPAGGASTRCDGARSPDVSLQSSPPVVFEGEINMTHLVVSAPAIVDGHPVVLVGTVFGVLVELAVEMRRLSLVMQQQDRRD